MASDPEIEVAIIGAGPAGISAAIQLKRFGIPFVILEKDRIGGLLWNANLIENYPGFPDGISGPELVALLEKQLRRIGVEVISVRVKKLDYEGSRFFITTDSIDYRPLYVIVATGTQPKPWPLPVPESITDRVTSDVVPLLTVSGKRIVIIGAGDAAFDHALNMAKKRNSVTILNHGQHVKCLSRLQDYVRLQPAIHYDVNMTVKVVQPAVSGRELVLECESDGRKSNLVTDYLVIATGRIPQLNFLSDNLRPIRAQLEKSGHLYFIGDVCNGMLRQMAIACGDGLRAAMLVHAEMREAEL